MEKHKNTGLRGVTTILHEMGLSPNKRFGQNFLIDENIITKIVEEGQLTEEDNVLEIGPGLGALTEKLIASKAKKIVSVEIDHGFADFLRDRYAEEEKFILVEMDFLKLDVPSFVEEVFHGEPFKVIANLPYNITTPILMTFLENDVPIQKAMVMVQKEVGERIYAKPATKKYGSLTVAIGFKADSRIALTVPASCFFPPPNVDSMVVALDFREGGKYPVHHHGIFTETLRAAFHQRRKTLLNSVSSSPYLKSLTKEDISAVFQKEGIQPTLRGETLTIEQFVNLSNAFACVIEQKNNENLL